MLYVLSDFKAVVALLADEVRSTEVFVIAFDVRTLARVAGFFVLRVVLVLAERVVAGFLPRGFACAIGTV
jgi:hypothetical protein